MRGVRLHSLPLFLVLCVLVAVVAGACGGGGENFTGSNDGGLHDGTVLGDSRLFGDVASFGDAPAGALVILPANKVVDVTVGQPIPTVPYTANEGGGPVAAAFSIDRGEIGAIDAGTGVFTPTGTTGGVATITATYGSAMATTTVTVFLHYSENGGAGDDAGSTGAGGNGGVGGEGEGGQVGGGTQNTLNGNPVADPGLAFLYPYDKTVWPRGLLSPLLQWQPGTSVASYD